MKQIDKLKEEFDARADRLKEENTNKLIFWNWIIQNFTPKEEKEFVSKKEFRKQLADEIMKSTTKIGIKLIPKEEVDNIHTFRTAIPIQTITLSKEEYKTVVYVEFKNKEYKVISELSDNNFCHSITAGGISEVIENEIEEPKKEVKEIEKIDYFKRKTKNMIVEEDWMNMEDKINEIIDVVNKLNKTKI